MFEIGKIYNRREDLHQKYGGNHYSGIAPCRNFPIIFLFSSPQGKQHGYEDKWLSDNSVYQYTGEGQFGDMDLIRGNFAIKNHEKRGRHLHLFEKVSSGYYKYIGEFKYIFHEVIVGPDTEQEKRNIILFNLQKQNPKVR